MKKTVCIFLFAAFISCKGGKTTEEMVTQAEITSDTTQDPVADTTKVMLEHLGDSIKDMREKAAEQAP